MGIILFPILFLAFGVWVTSAIFLILKLSNKDSISLWSLPLAIVISVIIYVLVLISWASKTEIWALQPLFDLPIWLVIVPGTLGIIGMNVHFEKPVYKLIGYAFTLAALISSILLIFIPSLSQPDALLNVQLTY